MRIVQKFTICSQLLPSAPKTPHFKGPFRLGSAMKRSSWRTARHGIVKPDCGGHNAKDMMCMHVRTYVRSKTYSKKYSTSPSISSKQEQFQVCGKATPGGHPLRQSLVQDNCFFQNEIIPTILLVIAMILTSGNYKKKKKLKTIFLTFLLLRTPLVPKSGMLLSKISYIVLLNAPEISAISQSR